MNTCQPLALGIAIGIVSALCIGLLGIAAIFDWGTDIVALLASFYIGYEASAVGALIGAAWGLVDGFIVGVLIAWIYNMAAKQ